MYPFYLGIDPGMLGGLDLINLKGWYVEAWRMPAEMLYPQEPQVERLRELLRPAAPGILSLYPVSKYVNKAGNEGKKCVAFSKGQD